VNPTSLKAAKGARSFLTTLIYSLHYLDFFPCGGKIIVTFTNFPWLTTSLGARRKTLAHLGGFISKSNKHFTNCLTKSTSAQRLGLLSLALSHPISQPNSLDLTRVKQSSQRGRGKRLKDYKDVFFMVGIS
jgi:hypothetical protein